MILPRAIIKIYQGAMFPFLAFRVYYLPIFIIYFSYGINKFSNIAYTFWVKNELNLSPVEQIEISFWLYAPWTYKIFFSSLLEGVKVLKGSRKMWIVIGGVFNLFGQVLMLTIAYKMEFMVYCFGSTYNQLIIALLLINIGFVIQDLVADTLCYEIVENYNHLEDKPLKEQLGEVQFLGKLTLKIAMIVAALIGGILASKYQYKDIISFALLIPLLSLISIKFNYGINSIESAEGLQLSIIIPAIAAFTISFFIKLLKLNIAYELVFTINLLFIVFIFKRLDVSIPRVENKMPIIYMFMIIFFYSMRPDFSPSLKWWQIDVLGFDPTFFSYLEQSTVIFGVIGTWYLGKILIKYDLVKITTLFTIVGATLKLPVAFVALELDKWTEQHLGFGAKAIIFLDTSLQAPFNFAYMVPVWAYFSAYAPKQRRFTWFAWVASMINLAMSAGEIISRYISIIFPNQKGDYTNIAGMVLTTIALDFLIPIGAILVCLAALRLQKV